MNPITDNSDGLDAKLACDKVIDPLSRDIAGLPVLNPIIKAAVEAAPCETDGDVADDAAGDTHLSEAASMHHRMSVEERIAVHNAQVVTKVMELMQPRVAPQAAPSKPSPLSSFMHSVREKATVALQQAQTLASIGDRMPRKILLQAFHAIRSVAAQSLAESGTFKPDLTMNAEFDYYAFADAVKFEVACVNDDEPEVSICTEELCVDVNDLDETHGDEVWGVPTKITGTWESTEGARVFERDWSAYLYEFVTVKGRKVAVYEVMED